MCMCGSAVVHTPFLFFFQKNLPTCSFCLSTKVPGHSFGKLEIWYVHS